MSDNIGIDVHISEMSPIIKSLEMLEKAYLPHTEEAIGASLAVVQQIWGNTAKKYLPKSTGGYASSIKIDPDFDEPFSGRVFSDHVAAAFLENGTKPFDMKKMLFTSSKARISKDGKRYMIIPFRHGTPGTNSNAMSPSLYRVASGMKSSKVTGHRYEKNVNQINPNSSEKTMRRNYDWGNRLNSDEIPKNRRGMVKMNTSSANAKSSAYMTFRIISEKHTDKWQNPGMGAKRIAMQASLDATAKVHRIIENAVAKDVEAIKEAMSNAN